MIGISLSLSAKQRCTELVEVSKGIRAICLLRVIRWFLSSVALSLSKLRRPELVEGSKGNS
jgi:hypothetical protein